MENCFYCDGKNPPKECIVNMRYYQNDDGDCYSYDIARKDLAKINAGQREGITLGNFLAEYLLDKGRTKEALEILTLP